MAGLGFAFLVRSKCHRGWPRQSGSCWGRRSPRGRVWLMLGATPSVTGPPRMARWPSGGSSRRCSGWARGMFPLCGENTSLIEGWTPPRWDITLTGVPEGGPGVLIPSVDSRGRNRLWEVRGVQRAPPPQRVQRLGKSAQVQGPPPPPPSCRGIGAGGGRRRCGGGGAYGGRRRRRPHAKPVSERLVEDKEATFKELLVLRGTAEEARDIARPALGNGRRRRPSPPLCWCSPRRRRTALWSACCVRCTCGGWAPSAAATASWAPRAGACRAPWLLFLSLLLLFKTGPWRPRSRLPWPSPCCCPCACW